MVEAYPLQYPIGKKRTERPEYSRFKILSISYVRDILLNELRKLGARNVVISSNLFLRNDGLPRSGQTEPQDKGVAIYFTYHNKQLCMACDKWNKVAHNLWAVAKSIEAIRGLERWGSKDMVESAFSGFNALPAPDSVIVAVPRFFDECVNVNDAKERFRRLAKELHPDNNGNADEFSEMKRQYDDFLKNTVN